MNLLDRLFRSEPMEKIFSDTEYLQGLLDFEAALARAESRVGIFPEKAARAIASKCRAELLDQNSIKIAASRSGNLAIPLIHQLTDRVAEDDPEAANFVHWGATSQDAMDCAVMGQLQSAFRITRSSLSSLIATLGGLVTAHGKTPTVARTWMQHAIPSTFGFIVAGWLDALLRDSRRLVETGLRVMVLQFGGAAGTLSALGTSGTAVAAELSRELKLPLPALPWHSHRDRMAEIATVFGLLMGTMAKIARDISLLSQTEIAELSEPYSVGSGGSSSMPHKRNPVHSAVILAAAQRVPPLVSTMLSSMVQEQQRGLGGWQAEWEVLPEIIKLTAGALEHLNGLTAGLEVHTRRMRENLEATNGLIYAEAASVALSRRIGKPAAHALVTSACNQAASEGRPLKDILTAIPQISSHLSTAELDRIFTPQDCLGSAEAFMARVLSDAADPLHSES